jgi:acetyl esterase
MTLDVDCIKIHELYRLANRPPLEQQTPDEARQAMLRGRPILQPDPPEMGDVREISAAGPDGTIPMRLYRPKGAAAGARLPALVFYHGGGWVIGDLDSHDVLCRQLCNASGAAVVAVDYRLAPEHRFPAAVDDAYVSLTWIAANAADLGIDALRLAVGGDSAGGNLAAVVALMARDRGGPALSLQLLIYPAVECGATGASVRTEAEVLPLTAKAMAWFWDHYLGGENSTAARDWRASPYLAANHAALPPAFVLVAEHDVLRDEGRAYASKLASAGVPVQSVECPGMIHGFITLGRIVRASGAAIDQCAGALKRAFAG